MKTGQVVVLDAVGDGRCGDGAIHPRRDFQSKVHGIGERCLQAAANSRPNLLGEPVGQLERDQHVVIANQRYDAQTLGGAQRYDC
jgi:hypothetical protein